MKSIPVLYLNQNENYNKKKSQQELNSNRNSKQMNTMKIRKKINIKGHVSISIYCTLYIPCPQPSVHFWIGLHIIDAELHFSIIM